MIYPIPICIDENENNMLYFMPSDTKIKNVLFSMEPEKSPNPDCFPPIFFQQNMEIIRNDLIHMIQFFLEMVSLLKN